MNLKKIIIVLAIIFVIGSGICMLFSGKFVNNQLKKASLSVTKDMAYGLRKTVQLYYQTALIENNLSTTIIFNCSDEGCISGDIKLDLNVTSPSSGTITLNMDGTAVYSDIVINGYKCEIPNSGEISCS